MSEPDEDRRKLVANERSKLTATYVNGLAIALFAVGGLAPMFAQRGASTGDVGQSWLTLLISLLCLCASAALHWRARGFLRELR